MQRIDPGLHKAALCVGLSTPEGGGDKYCDVVQRHTGRSDRHQGVRLH
jgi:hypothetical protein